ncbi:hypothetical protein AAF712_008029 [Marasmius tenuissimus]|uniref:Uncharacterized protein n=1 Tax=Marasmius tenuissimus TaxID=585030 RepID=A0ABR2ZUN8_9AGAR
MSEKRSKPMPRRDSYGLPALLSWEEKSKRRLRRAPNYPPKQEARFPRKLGKSPLDEPSGASLTSDIARLKYKTGIITDGPLAISSNGNYDASSSEIGVPVGVPSDEISGTQEGDDSTGQQAIDEPDFELGVLFDGGEERGEGELIGGRGGGPRTQPAPLEEEGEKEEEDPWRTMPALRVIYDTEDEDDEGDARGGWMFDSDSSSEDEDEDENTPPVSWYTPPRRDRDPSATSRNTGNPPPPPLPTPDRNQLLREMDGTRILTAALRRYTLPTPPSQSHSTLPIEETIPYAPPLRTRAPPFSINSTRDTPRPPLFSVNSGSTASWAHRNWDVNAYAPPPVDCVRSYLGRPPPPRMERSFGGMGRVGTREEGEDEDEDEGDDVKEEEEEEEDSAVVIKTGTGNGVLFAM